MKFYSSRKCLASVRFFKFFHKFLPDALCTIDKNTRTPPLKGERRGGRTDRVYGSLFFLNILVVTGTILIYHLFNSQFYTCEIRKP